MLRPPTTIIFHPLHRRRVPRPHQALETWGGMCLMWYCNIPILKMFRMNLHGGCPLQHRPCLPMRMQRSHTGQCSKLRSAEWRDVNAQTVPNAAIIENNDKPAESIRLFQERKLHKCQTWPFQLLHKHRSCHWLNREDQRQLVGSHELVKKTKTPTYHQRWLQGQNECNSWWCSKTSRSWLECGKHLLPPWDLGLAGLSCLQATTSGEG